MKFIRSTGDLISASSRLWPPRLPEWLLSQPSENAGSIEILAAKDVLAKLLLISKSRNKFGGKLLVELTTVDIGIYFRYHVRQSNIQLTCYSFRSNFVKTRLRCSLLNCSYTLQVLQQVATNDQKPNGRCASVHIVKYKRLDS